jgi:hypothetical protein
LLYLAATAATAGMRAAANRRSDFLEKSATCSEIMNIRAVESIWGVDIPFDTALMLWDAVAMLCGAACFP